MHRRHMPNNPIRALALLTIVLAANTQAATIYSQTDPTISGAIFAEVTQWPAQSFTVGGTAATLDSVDVRMWQFIQGTPGNFQVQLWSNSGSNLPGTLLETLLGPTNPAANSTSTYTASGVTVLAANTTYWIVEKVTSGDAIYAWGAQIPVGLPEIGSDIGHSVTTDSGASWQAASTTGYTNQMVVNGTFVPVPAAVWLFGGALGVLGWVKRKAAA